MVTCRSRDADRVDQIKRCGAVCACKLLEIGVERLNDRPSIGVGGSWVNGDCQLGVTRQRGWQQSVSFDLASQELPA